MTTKQNLVIGITLVLFHSKCTVFRFCVPCVNAIFFHILIYLILDSIFLTKKKKKKMADVVDFFVAAFIGLMCFLPLALLCSKRTTT
jgi:uncharacterized membrane protein SirB2